MALLDRQDNNDNVHWNKEQLETMINTLPLHLQLNVVRTNKDIEQMSRDQAIGMCKYLYTNHLVMEQSYKDLIKQELLNSGSIPFNFK